MVPLLVEPPPAIYKTEPVRTAAILPGAETTSGAPFLQDHFPTNPEGPSRALKKVHASLKPELRLAMSDFFLQYLVFLGARGGPEGSQSKVRGFQLHAVALFQAVPEPLAPGLLDEQQLQRSRPAAFGSLGLHVWKASP